MSRVIRGILLIVALTAVPALADWNVGDPYKMHYPQLPDMTPTGLDILAGRQLPTVGNQFKIVADDWKCIESGAVNDIHIWGSWLNDVLPAGNPQNVTFKLSIHMDVPVGSGGTNFSHPGDVLWQTVIPAGGFVARPWGSGTEGFYDPNVGQVIGTDHEIWQYNFTQFPIAPFIQQAGQIYWLDVQAQPGTTDALFGWKTTNPQVTPHFQDDSVFADTAAFNGPLVTGWNPLVYPANHPLAGQSMDQAFVITPEPASGLIALLGGAWCMLPRRSVRSRR